MCVYQVEDSVYSTFVLAGVGWKQSVSPRELCSSVFVIKTFSLFFFAGQVRQRPNQGTEGEERWGENDDDDVEEANFESTLLKVQRVRYVHLLREAACHQINSWLLFIAIFG